MHVDIVTIQPNGTIPSTETHAMERGIFVLSGSALYKLNEDWVQVDAGDSLRLHSFCPQACYVSGPEQFRYLQYKAVNRQCRLS
ncbi:cupin domain-containing protein [Arthrobacter sp. CJ23]|nr:cupin domain-containing protein [Arthrobacter sp. CJ23]UVJ38948.1 cupin domain-containing protein [Arthrobacter sp. CJ23]